MPEFMLHHTHEPDECQAVFGALKEPGGAESLSGSRFFCCCPSGEHGGYFTVEAADADAAVAMLPSRLQPTTRAYAGETMEV